MFKVMPGEGDGTKELTFFLSPLMSDDPLVERKNSRSHAYIALVGGVGRCTNWVSAECHFKTYSAEQIFLFSSRIDILSLARKN